MRIFTESEASIRLGAAYLAVVVLSYPFTAVTNVFVAMLRAVGKVTAPVATSCMAICTNIFFNFLFIFPERAVLIGGRSITIPGLGTTMYSLAYGRMGDDAVAAITIATTIQDIVVVLFQGLSAATAVILGNEMGAGKLKRAEKYATYFFILQFLVTVTGGLLIAAGRWQVIGFYKITPQVAADVSALILIFVAYMPAKMFNYVNVVGVLRSGGDTKMCLFLDTSGVWAIGVPLAFLGGLVWKNLAAELG